ncbi:fused MFS/spermidine synthase [Paenibacillus polymyxa]|uniref:Spermidine synthase n=1 Tax=Paenibacillus polymyxa TaxID=1406 RepID=A0A378XYN8_PAEPO|nr:fused MFS/spermidine synthase [Paenibacillus polymyxa]MBE7899954.1 fused MFS/spermidine synthase [Paenibacillus polymyxa]MCC3259624.1 fused MFS/spermidine synthase [Paenibacillus polymyxa]NMP07866.1 fused MFS/spermidine synthase [Paenibacillus polymyxa]QPK55388.1 spermidine synthase [Paenibacillus polymyxa]QPK60476.1 spermidine synthase [Paenibacillus polymyxa]
MKEIIHLDVLHKKLSNNHEITVYETTELYGEKGLFRVMQFSNAAIQGALDLNHPQRILFEYPRAIIHLMELNDPSFEDVFVIGHGIGTIAGHFTDKRFKIAELDSQVVEFSRTFFGYDQNNVTIGDGRRILEKETPDAYDYIILDAFTEQGTPLHLVSWEFFKMAKEKLDSEGSLIMNVMGKSEHDHLVHAIHTTLREEFAYVTTFSLPSEGVADIQNIIMIGRDKPIRFQARQMADFHEITLGEGHILRDTDA